MRSLMSSVGGLAAFALSSVAVAGPVTSTLFYTTFSGGQNVWKVKASYDGDGTAGNGTFILSNDTNIASTGGADGIVLNPNNNQLLVGGQGNAVHQVNPNNGTFTSATPTVNAFHLAVDPGKQVVWASSIPGALASLPINPFGGSGSILSLSGDDTAITSLAFTPGGTVFYTNAGASGFGSFGTIDLTTGVTTRKLANVAAAHGMVFDPFSGDLILGGSDQIAQIDPSNPTTILHSILFPGDTFDQGAVDGKGHIFWADNGGRAFFMDYSNTMDVSDPNNFVSNSFFKGSLDDFAPLIGSGGTGSDDGTVPEPGILALLAIGALGFKVAKRRIANS
jgi:WD40 repeat protein